MEISKSEQEDIEDGLTNENIEIALFLKAIKMKYGYDFCDYSKAHLKRRIKGRLSRSGLANISEMQHKIINDADFFHEMLLDLSLNVTEMFRDPLFFKAIREIVVPMLKTYPYLKIWHAGCSTGEEVYSMAILLKEECLLDRCIIYATDFNQVVLDKATSGIYSVEQLQNYSKNYHAAGGVRSISDYFTAQYDGAIIDAKLKKNIVFSDHNLVSDGEFGEMNLIVCRNVLIYFNRELQNKVFRLLNNSLVSGGVLCIGSKETLMFSEIKDSFTPLHKLNIYKKKYE